MDNNTGCGMSSDDDPVVKEVPIFLSKRLADQMYIFQYPLHPTHKPSDNKVSKCLFKPNNQEVQLEVSIDVHSKYFDYDRAEYIADQVDKCKEKKKDSVKVFQSNYVDKTIYHSSKAVKNPSKYAVGIYNGKEYHLTPVKGFLQLRPDFSFMDKTLKRKKDEINSDDEEEAGPSSAQQVTVKFARSETEQMKKARENSFKTLQEKSAQEPWMECQYKSLKSTESEVLKYKLFAENTVDIDQAKNIEPMSYIKILVPDDREELELKKPPSTDKL